MKYREQVKKNKVPGIWFMMTSVFGPKFKEVLVNINIFGKLYQEIVSLLPFLTKIMKHSWLSKRKV